MKTKRLALCGLALVIVALFVVGCPNPITLSKGGSLSIQVSNHINARTLLPPTDMTAASFTVSGTGPGGASFSQTTSAGGSVMLNNLAFGSWSVTVNALNAAGTIIGSGQAMATVDAEQTATVDITVVPLGGNGTLNLTVTWPASQVQNASIQASLTPPSGPATQLSFSVSGNQATYSSTTIPAGYQTLVLQLLDNNHPVMGAVEVVRIVAGQTTTGSYTFTNSNQPGIQMNITPAMADPIPVGINGVGTAITAGTSITATASVSDSTTNVVYVWYLNGVSQATGSSYTFGSDLAAGYYRLDVTAYTADGTRAGSANSLVRVTSGTMQVITTVAGNGTQGFSGDGGAATSAQINNPLGIAVDAAGNIYIGDLLNSRIRKVSTIGIITTVAGNGTQGFSGDGGAATSAQIGQPRRLVVDSSGNIYFADTTNNRIRKVNTSGTIITLAGNGSPGFSGDGGAATSAELNSPSGVAVDSSGNVFVADTLNSCIRKVSTNGTITTIAGNGTPGFSGDSGAATLAKLNWPWGVAVDSSGNIYFTDNNNYRIRKVNTSGIITTVAGNGTPGFSGDGGAATSAELNSSYGDVSVNSSGNLYFADNNNHRIREVDTLGIITTVAGSGSIGFSGDGGAATSAELNSPQGVTVDSSGNIYIADTGNHRIREVH